MMLIYSIENNFAQNAVHKWNVGLHGGFMQYRGDLGNGFYRFGKAFYGHVGISVNRYLNRHWDVSALATRGVVGFLGNWNEDPEVPTHFLTNMTTMHLLGRYHFLRQDSWIRPYLTAGASALLQSGSGDSYINRGKKPDFALPIGLGLKFQMGEYLGIQLQELLYLNNFDDIDFHVRGGNDLYLLHSVALTFNLGKLGKLGAEQPQGVGDKIDQCPKVKQYKNKVRADDKVERKTKAQGKSKTKKRNIWAFLKRKKN